VSKGEGTVNLTELLATQFDNEEREVMFAKPKKARVCCKSDGTPPYNRVTMFGLKSYTCLILLSKYTSLPLLQRLNMPVKEGVLESRF
jgi:hypothetical protein